MNRSIIEALSEKEKVERILELQTRLDQIESDSYSFAFDSSGNTPTTNIKPYEISLYHMLIYQSVFALDILQDNKIAFVNPAFVDMVKVPEHELIGMTVDEALQFVHPDDRKIVNENTQKQIHGEYSTQVYEFRIIDAENNLHWVELHANSISYHNKHAILATYIDITERKYSQERYEIIADSNLLGVCIFQDNRIKFCNPAFANIYGYSIDELMDIPPDRIWQQLIHHEDIDMLKERNRARLRGENPPTSYEYRGIHRSGNIIWIEIHTHIVHYQGRRATHSTFIDITERVNAENALNESRQNILSLIENTTDSIWSVDCDYKVIVLNSVIYQDYLNIFGAELKPGINILEYVPEPISSQWKSHYDRALAGDTFRIEWNFTFNEQTRFYDVSFSPIYSEDRERITGVSIFSRDITRRMMMAESLEESQQLVKAITDNFPYAILVYDLINDQLVFANPVSLEIMGRTHEDTGKITREEITSNYHPDEIDAMDDRLKKIKKLPDGEVLTSHIRMHNSDGEWRWFQLQTLVFKRLPDGVVHQILSLLIDVTEQKEAEEKDRQIALEQDRIHLITNFIRIASHEFRTPLSSINTMTHLIRNIAQDERINHYIKRIEEEAYSILKLVQALLTMSRLDSEFKFQMAKVDINQMVLDIISRYRNRSSDTPQIEALIDNSPLYIEGDAEYLEVAFVELIGNAVRYTPVDGKVTVTIYSNEGTVYMEITDTGMGMDKAVLARIFDRFYRADSSHSTRGFGLGLPISQKIIERHGGQISVISQLNHGSTFTIEFPSVES